MIRGAWPAAATRFLAIRLLPGSDLRESLEATFDAEPEAAGFVAASVGSLTGATLRPAGLDQSMTVAGPLEIVCLSGTFSVDGPHLHLCVSDEAGAMRGGHLLAGCRVRTTAEIVLALGTGVRFARSLDPVTGYRELFIEQTSHT